MQIDLTLALILSAALETLAIFAFAIFWHRRLRKRIAERLNEASQERLVMTQRLGDAICSLQKQNRVYEQQVQNLMQSNIRMRQDMVTLSSRLDHGDRERPIVTERTLH